ncbi:MAG: MBL fold metallo-hydrolase [Deltaproteobacteria bacterium]|nr:MBL fold metallo-hydrolase [Deltaproteobacteria bacterium]
MAPIFRQLLDPRSSTWTYLLASRDTREAVLIDPVFEQFARDAALLAELELRLVYTLETHVHADHVTSAWLCKQRLGSRIGVAAAAGATGADLEVRPGDVIRFGAEALEVRATPGHTNGCVTYVSADHLMAFTGDALLVRAAGRTDFQQGDAHLLYRSVHQQIFTLPDDCMVYPAHDYQGRTATSVGEERRHNPRLGGTRSETDFVGFSSNLDLPHPKQLEVAVPANQRCGRPEVEPAPDATWGPVTRSFAGVPSIDPLWLEEHRAEVLLLDVREAAELHGELGHIDGAVHIPLGQLRARAASLPTTRPIVAVCRSGGRSAQACTILAAAGLTQLANLSGGMVEWRSLGLPVADAAP